MMTIGQAIHARRTAAGVSVKELSKRTSLSAWTIYTWENDRHTPRLLELWAVADVLGCSIDELIGRTQDERKQ